MQKARGRGGGAKKELLPLGQQQQADRVVWHDDGSLSFGKLSMRGWSLGGRQD